MARPTDRRRPRTTGFSLVELLVVIGIIVVLIGILLPVLNNARKSAWRVDSQAAITNLATAIESYRMDFHAYPGIFSNAQITGRPIAGPGGNPITMSENLVLSLLGGYEVGESWSGWEATSTIGRGAISHSPIAATRQRGRAYLSADAGRVIQAKPWDRPAFTSASEGWDSLDSQIPEFIDRFPEPMPVLYMRAQTGAPGIVATADGKQYNFNHLTPYARPAASGFSGDFKFGAGEDFQSAQQYFHDPADGDPNTPSTWTRPRQKDGFWLIGAGPDRKFGTKDDQTNFGSL